MERRKNTCEILLERYRKKSFLHRIVTGDEKWIFFENPKRKKSWVDPGAFHSHRPQDRIALAGRRCSVFGGTRRMWSIMSYWSLAKRLIPNVINNNWSIWTVRCLKHDQNIKRGKGFSMTMFHHIRQNQFGTRWKYSAGKFYPMRLTHLGSFRLSLVCIDGSRTCWAALWFVRRCEKMARWMVRGKRGRFLLECIHKLPER